MARYVVTSTTRDGKRICTDKVYRKRATAQKYADVTNKHWHGLFNNARVKRVV